MARKPRFWGLFVVSLVLGSSAVNAQGPTVAQIINYRPRMDDVVYSIPTPEEMTQCKVEPIVLNGRKVGWAVIDGKHQTLRRFFDSNGDNKIDIWSYYKDGVEVYREIDTKGTERPNHYRWFNDGGMKWGIDYNGKGKIDYWQYISADEVGHEVFQALATNNFERLQALFITEKEMSEIRLSHGEMKRVREQLARAQNKFREAAAKIRPGSKFVRVESAAPNCVPGETLKMDTDLIHYPSRPILYEVGGVAKSTHDWVQTGEMIQVGLKWRLADGPGEMSIIAVNPEAEKIQKLIADIDAQGPVLKIQNKQQLERLMTRVSLIERLLPYLPPQEREGWIRQMLDNLMTAAADDAAAMTRLGQLEAQLIKSMPGSSLTAHAAYNKLCATWLPFMSGEKPLPKELDMKKVQQEWQDGLSKFVQGFPNCDDTPEALLQLAIGCEFTGKEEEGKRWYTQLCTNFPSHAHADKAKGSVRRLDCVGQPMELVSTMLNGNPVPFNIAQLKGKFVAVYYWTSYCTSCPRDFATLKQAQTNLAAKGLELVFVNLDDEAAEAVRFLASHPIPGVHLYQQSKNAGGGLNGPLATHYGINGLPTLFLVGRDGRVVNRTLDVTNLEDIIKKLP